VDTEPSWRHILHQNGPLKRSKSEEEDGRRARKKIFHSKLFEEDPEEETNTVKPVSLPDIQNGGGNCHIWGSGSVQSDGGGE